MSVDQIRRGTALLREGLTDFDPHLLTGEDAARLVRVLAEAERAVVAAKALSARRVEETNVHKRHGHRDAEGPFLADGIQEHPRVLSGERRFSEGG